MAEGGLFSGLKFTDVFFPAAAAAASAYNPYIGQGLQTGMNLFNSMAAFQHDVKSFAQQKKEWDQLQEDRKRGLEAAGTYSGFVGDKISDREEIARKAAIAQIDGDTQFGVHGPGGPAIAATEEPASAEDAPLRFSEATTAAPSEFSVFGGEQLPGPSFQDQMAETALSPTSEAMPWLVDQKVEEALAGDLDYQTLRERQATANMMGGTMGLSPGSSIATLGNLAQGATSGMQERARMLQGFKDLEMQRENQLVRENYLRQARHEDNLELQREITEQKKVRGQEHKAVMAYIMGMSQTVDTMSASDAGEEVRRMTDVITDMKLAMDPDDPDFMNAWVAAHEYLNKVRAISQGLVVPADKTSGGEEAERDQEKLRKAQDAQNRLKGIIPGGVNG